MWLSVTWFLGAYLTWAPHIFDVPSKHPRHVYWTAAKHNRNAMRGYYRSWSTPHCFLAIHNATHTYASSRSNSTSTRIVLGSSAQASSDNKETSTSTQVVAMGVNYIKANICTDI